MRKIDADEFKRYLKENTELTLQDKMGQGRLMWETEQRILRLQRFLADIDKQPTVDDWIPCSKAMPEEHDSAFSKLKGTDKWHKCMWGKASDKVNVTVEFTDGTRKAMTSYTQDGIWQCCKEYRIVKMKVIAWKPIGEPYKGVEKNESTMC